MVDDVGTVMNPLLLKGQIVGGVAQGVGQILKEDINFDAERPAHSPARSWTTPCRARTTSATIEVKANPVPTKTNPLGVKGAGEAGCVGAMPAVANALVNALSEFGVRHIEMPATPEVVWARDPPVRVGQTLLADAQVGQRIGHEFARIASPVNLGEAQPSSGAPRGAARGRQTRRSGLARNSGAVRIQAAERSQSAKLSTCSSTTLLVGIVVIERRRQRRDRGRTRA